MKVNKQFNEFFEAFMKKNSMKTFHASNSSAPIKNEVHVHIYTLDTKQTNLPEGDLNSKKIFHKTTHILILMPISLSTF